MSLDGTVTYSSIIPVVNARSLERVFNIIPSDANMVRIEYTIPETQNGTMQVMDVSGRIHFERKLRFVKGKNVHSFPITGLPVGTYVIRVVHNDRVESEKMVISD